MNGFPSLSGKLPDVLGCLVRTGSEVDERLRGLAFGKDPAQVELDGLDELVADVVGDEGVRALDQLVGPQDGDDHLQSKKVRNTYH